MHSWLHPWNILNRPKKILSHGVLLANLSPWRNFLKLKKILVPYRLTSLPAQESCNAALASVDMCARGHQHQGCGIQRLLAELALQHPVLAGDGRAFLCVLCWWVPTPRHPNPHKIAEHTHGSRAARAATPCHG